MHRCPGFRERRSGSGGRRRKRQMNRLDSSSNRARSAESAGPGGDSALVREAVVRAKNGDREALHFLYVRYSPEVLRYVRKLVQDDYEAEDITQNVFMKLMSVIGKYQPREVPFAAWILRVARNAALDYLRARRTTPTDEVRNAARICAERSRGCPTNSATSSSSATSSASPPSRSPPCSARRKARSTACTIAAD
jgi:RNA polymerase sigma factor (sigma-70 family)